MNEQERKLLAYFRKLAHADAHALLQFAAFLAGDKAQLTHAVQAEASDAAATEIPQPQLGTRPENERVVDALKRLATAYPMLEKKQLLDKASALVAQHVMFGKSAKVVIDEIEKLFADAYAQFVSEREGK